MSHRAPLFASPRHRPATAATAAIVIMLVVIPAAFAYSDPGGPDSAQLAIVDAGAEAATHLVISEVMTGGVSASDEFIELYNPTAAELPLDGLELVYVTASGATVTRKATWGTDALGIPAGAHVLVANESGAFAPLADATYAAGLSATGGSVALRVVGDVTAIDAVGWGSAASTWLEGTPSVAPSAQHSLERLPGGGGGSTQDTDDNAADFVEREIPDPQNRAAPPVSGTEPTPTPGPTDSPPPTPTPAPTPLLTPTPIPTFSQVSSIEAARALADGTAVTIEGVALTDSAFADGGGFVADGTGGIAVLLSDGTFARGDRLRLSGTVDDRYAQRTIRSSGEALVVLGTGEEPTAAKTSTGSIGEQREGQLVEVGGVLQGGATVLSGARAFDLDDGSGAIRIYVGDATGLETAGWMSGVQIRVRGVAGQRDSSGSGTSGYRIMPRDQADLLEEGTPTPAPSSSASASASPSASAPASPSAQPLLTIAQARAAGKNDRVQVRGVVTLPTGLMDPGSAALQDGSGAIFLRPSDEAGSLSIGQQVELVGTRSSWTGMESIRISVPPTVIASGPLPAPVERATGEVGEAEEALLIRVQGEVTSGPQRTSAQNLIFDLDDGSGPLRVYVSPPSGISTSGIARGAQLVITGVLLQETTGQQPLRGYRLWPTSASDVTVAAAVLPEIAESEAPESSGGVLGVGSTPDPDRTAAAIVSARPQPVPRLTLAVPTMSAAVVVTAAPREPAGPDGSPLPPAVPAALAAVALAGAGGLLARHGFGERLAALLPRPETMDEQHETGPAPDLSIPLAAAGELLPLSVVPRTDVRAEGSTPEHGRILPRT